MLHPDRYMYSGCRRASWNCAQQRKFVQPLKASSVTCARLWWCMELCVYISFDTYPQTSSTLAQAMLYRSTLEAGAVSQGSSCGGGVGDGLPCQARLEEGLRNCTSQLCNCHLVHADQRRRRGGGVGNGLLG